MKKYNIVLLTILLSFLALSGLSGLTNESVSIHMHITNTEQGQSPVFIGRKILFSYSAPSKKRFIRRVGISFGFEDYRVVYPFFKNEKNVFIYVADVPAGIASIDYRIIVDGLWIADPNSPQTVVSNDGFPISRVEIPAYLKYSTETPVIKQGRTVQFIYSGDSGKSVFLAGNFNNWDPFMLRMKEDPREPGLYSLSIKIPSGNQYYTFIADGKEIIDPNNPKKAIDKNGKRVSYLFVP